MHVILLVVALLGTFLEGIGISGTKNNGSGGIRFGWLGLCAFIASFLIGQ